VLSGIYHSFTVLEALLVHIYFGKTWKDDLCEYNTIMLLETVNNC